MLIIRYKYVSADVDRHGNVRYYFRKRGLIKKTRLPGRPGDPDFQAAYDALFKNGKLPAILSAKSLDVAPSKNSLRWLCLEYLSSAEFRCLDIKTRANRERLLNTICEQPVAPGSKEAPIGGLPFAELTAKHIRRLRDRKAETPEAANDWLKSLKAVFKWAVELEHCDYNPAKEVPKFKSSGQGFHTWTLDEVRQFEQVHAIGTTPRLALALLLYTGQRRSDVVLFGPQHIRDGWLRFTQQKNRIRKPVTLEIPVLPILAETIAATPSGHMTFLVTQYGKPFTVGGFGARFKRWAVAAGLPNCTPHGLRKAGAVQAAENGATASQLMAIYGWSDIKQAERYTKAADQKRLAGDSMHLIGRQDAK